MKSNEIIIVGGFIEIIELCESLNYTIKGIIDKIGTNEIYGYPVLGTDEDIEEIQLTYKGSQLIITPDSQLLRSKLYSIYKEFDFDFPIIVSRNAFVSKSANLGIGTVVQTGCNISSEVVIGQFVKVNTHANIMHNSIIKDFVTIAPNAVVLGNVWIGNHCYIGSNATVLPNLKIADGVTIGAGAVVTKHIDEPGTYAGIPAKRLV